jgi:hypothetical protein
LIGIWGEIQNRRQILTGKRPVTAGNIVYTEEIAEERGPGPAKTKKIGPENRAFLPVEQL